MRKYELVLQLMKKDWYTRMEKMENGNPFLPTSFYGLYHFWIGEEDTYFKLLHEDVTGIFTVKVVKVS